MTTLYPFRDIANQFTEEEFERRNDIYGKRSPVYFQSYGSFRVTKSSISQMFHNSGVLH